MGVYTNLAIFIPNLLVATFSLIIDQNNILRTSAIPRPPATNTISGKSGRRAVGCTVQGRQSLRRGELLINWYES